MLTTQTSQLKRSYAFSEFASEPLQYLQKAEFSPTIIRNIGSPHLRPSHSDNFLSTLNWIDIQKAA